MHMGGGKENRGVEKIACNAPHHPQSSASRTDPRTRPKALTLTRTVNRCIVCNDRPALNSEATYPTCGTCRSAVCRLRQLDEQRLRVKTKQAITRLKRIVAARFGVAHRIVQTQYDVTEPDLQS